MSDAPNGTDDPLLRAIVEFRDEINRLFDEQSARLIAHAGDPVSRVVPPAGPPSSDEARSRSTDPRPRLDALAKHLDLRRRVGASPAVPERIDQPTET